ncbi:protein FAR1-RELATED SEQUENCE 1-like [Carya illinoinensis]|uniref:protein FAR1-RELATED SEQUENCE 1-like n=1 Tax=Carya illinoinensis TaxID=32201 RepID=UPI001C728AA6|nr:protein FAR1-RELATED SEQUENCE 1-like [Carya illinoinensis]
MKYDLTGNNWLELLYEDRSFWVPAYLKSVFWAGMSTTQKSESMNAFFDGYVHSETTLKEFVDQFNNALRKKVEVEIVADFNSNNQTISCVSHFNIEKQFQKLYTNAKFKEVQGDVLDEISIDDHIKTVQYSVYYNEEEMEVKCNYALFETRCILCRHAFRICQLKKINVLLDRYLLDHWKKDLKRRYTLLRSSYDDQRDKSDARNYEFVIKRCSQLATKISSDNKQVSAFLRVLNEFDTTCDASAQESTFDQNRAKPDEVLDKGKKVLSPNMVRGKGRPPSKRKMPPVEKLATKRKRPTCRKILVDETQLGDTAGSQQHQFDDGVGVGTQTSILTQSTPLGNEMSDSIDAMYVPPWC